MAPINSATAPPPNSSAGTGLSKDKLACFDIVSRTAAADSNRFEPRLPCQRSIRLQRQINRDLSPFAELAFHRHAPAVVLHDAFAHRQPRPNPVRFLPVKKGSKILGRSPGAMLLP
jgi:hypothetical protein